MKKINETIRRTYPSGERQSNHENVEMSYEMVTRSAQVNTDVSINVQLVESKVSHSRIPRDFADACCLSGSINNCSKN